MLHSRKTQHCTKSPIDLQCKILHDGLDQRHEVLIAHPDGPTHGADEVHHCDFFPFRKLHLGCPKAPAPSSNGIGGEEAALHLKCMVWTCDAEVARADGREALENMPASLLHVSRLPAHTQAKCQHTQCESWGPSEELGRVRNDLHLLSTGGLCLSGWDEVICRDFQAGQERPHRLIEFGERA
jgi:hypothetical protein